MPLLPSVRSCFRKGFYGLLVGLWKIKYGILRWVCLFWSLKWHFVWAETHTRDFYITDALILFIMYFVDFDSFFLLLYFILQVLYSCYLLLLIRNIQENNFSINRLVNCKSWFITTLLPIIKLLLWHYHVLLVKIVVYCDTSTSNNNILKFWLKLDMHSPCPPQWGRVL